MLCPSLPCLCPPGFQCPVPPSRRLIGAVSQQLEAVQEQPGLALHCSEGQFAPHVGNLAGQLSSVRLEERVVTWQGGCPSDFGLGQSLNHAMHLLTAFSPGSKHPPSYPAKTIQPCLNWPNLTRKLGGPSLSRGRARSATVHPIHLSSSCTVVCSEPICPPLHSSGPFSSRSLISRMPCLTCV